MVRSAIATGALLLMLLPSLGRAQTADHPADQKLRVGAEIGFAPFNFREADGTVTGFEVEMNGDIAKRLGRPGIEVVDVVWANIFAAMAAKRVEYIIGPMTITPQRAQEMLFGEPYFNVALAFLTRQDHRKHKVEDFKGEAVAVTSGSVQDDWMRDNAAKYGIEVQRFDKTADAMQAVAIGRVAAYMTTQASGLWMAKTQKTFALDVIVPTGQVFALPFRKDDAAFRDIVDDKLKCMKKDGTLAAVYKKWFDADAAPDSAIVTVYPGHGAKGWPGYVADAPEPKCS